MREAIKESVSVTVLKRMFFISFFTISRISSVVIHTMFPQKYDNKKITGKKERPLYKAVFRPVG